MKCILCNERNGKTRCEGCDSLFCLSCMNKHHDELVQQFQLLMDVRNEIKQSFDITGSTLLNGKKVSCLIEIDEWEREIIQCIQQIAAKLRTNVNEIMMKHMNEISQRFEKLTVEMQQRQKEEDYLENDIERVKNQLDQLKNDIEHVFEKIQVDSSMSNNIDWNKLISIIEEELPSQATSESVQTKDQITKDKKKPAVFNKLSKPQKVSDSSSMIFQTEQAAARTSEASLIPIHVVKANSSSDNPNLIDSNQRSDRSGTCVICHRFFHDSSSMVICSDCDQKVRISISRLNPSIQTQTQNMYLSTYDRDYAAALSPTPNTRNSLMMSCPYCKYPNLLKNVLNNSGYYCVVCHNFIPSASY